MFISHAITRDVKAATKIVQLSMLNDKYMVRKAKKFAILRNCFFAYFCFFERKFKISTHVEKLSNVMGVSQNIGTAKTTRL